MDALYLEFCEQNGIVMDSPEDHEDYAARGHLYDDPGSDVHDHCNAP